MSIIDAKSQSPSPVDQKEPTHKEIGEAAGLSGQTLAVFLAYVGERFPTSVPDYIDEWAQRFAQRRAYAASDNQGRAILDSMGFCDGGAA